MLKRYEVVRYDGDMSVELGYSYRYYEVDEQGQFWRVSPHSDGRSRVEGLFPSIRADMAAISSFVATGTWARDKYWLICVRGVC